MRPGDMLVVDTTPPHIASVISTTQVICEDGSVLEYDQRIMTKICDALEVIKELERSILQLHETG